MTTVRDFLGNLIVAGRCVVYPSKDESMLKMNVGKVIEVSERVDFDGESHPEVVVNVVDIDGSERKSRVVAYERMVVIPESAVNDERFIALFN